MSQPQGTCPVCEKDLQNGDDVVVCPDCGTPYHRECYVKEGRCIYADKHGSGYEYKRPAGHSRPGTAGGFEGAQSGKGVQCANCGATNSAQGIFCESCGAPLHRAPQTPPQGQNPAGAFGMYGMPAAPDLKGEIDGISKKDWDTYIGPSSATYSARMSQQQQRGSKFGFLISAFFFPQFFFAYRKMWGWAAVGLLLTFASMVPDVLMMLYTAGTPVIPGYGLSDYDSLVTIVYMVSLLARMALGWFATYLYRQNAGKRIKRLREQMGEGPEYRQSLHKKGGTSPLAVVMVFAIFFLAVALVTYVFGIDVTAYYTGLF